MYANTEKKRIRDVLRRKKISQRIKMMGRKRENFLPN